MVSTVGAANPFRYRGYYYDFESGFYYLNSRYYDTYNADGVRVGKSGQKSVSYTVSGSQILSETSGGETIYYIYDENGQWA